MLNINLKDLAKALLYYLLWMISVVAVISLPVLTVGVYSACKGIAVNESAHLSICMIIGLIAICTYMCESFRLKALKISTQCMVWFGIIGAAVYMGLYWSGIETTPLWTCMVLLAAQIVISVIIKIWPKHSAVVVNTSIISILTTANIMIEVLK